MATLDKDDVEALSVQLIKAMRAGRDDFFVEREKHFRHHVFIEQLIDRMQREEHLKLSRKEKIVGGLAWAGIVSAIWFTGYAALRVGKEFLLQVFQHPPLGG